MRALTNAITLVRVPVIVLLAIVVSPNSGGLALGLFVLGLVSHASDGVLAKWSGRATAKPGEFWHEADTAWLSLGLQLGAAIWLIRADVLSWQVLAIYLVAVGVLQVFYVDRRKSADKPFVPVVLLGSGPVWLFLAGMLAKQADADLTFVLTGIVALAILNLFFHEEVWNGWLIECKSRFRIS